MAIAKIWRNRIEAGTRMLSNCPLKYRDEVVSLIREDIEMNRYTTDMLRKLVEDGLMTEDEYNEIVG